jgi:cell wall-associated NlpC family hydrolase
MMREADFLSIIVPIAPLLRDPAPDAFMDNELLFGEQVDILDTVEGWHRLRSRTDGYEGFVQSQSVGFLPPPTHVVAIPGSFLYREADLKSPALGRLSFLSSVKVDGKDGKYVRTPQGYLRDVTVKPLGRLVCKSPAEAARLFLNLPYRLGGRSSLGLDCSALVQLAHAACGVALPRDSNPQRDFISRTVLLEDVQEGDLIFSPGHVMLATGRSTVIHANASYMRVTEEPLEAALSRLSPEEREQVVAKPGPLRHHPAL